MPVTCHARYMPVTIKAKHILPGTCQHGTCHAWLCELETFQSRARPRALCMNGSYYYLSSRGNRKNYIFPITFYNSIFPIKNSIFPITFLKMEEIFYFDL